MTIDLSVVAQRDYPRVSYTRMVVEAFYQVMPVCASVLVVGCHRPSAEQTLPNHRLVLDSSASCKCKSFSRGRGGTACISFSYEARQGYRLWRGTSAPVGDLKLYRTEGGNSSRNRNIVIAIVAHRILSSGGKLATAQALNEECQTSSLGQDLGLSRVLENRIYEAMSWLYARMEASDGRLLNYHLTEGSLVLCDVVSAYVERYGADLTKLGYGHTTIAWPAVA